MLIFLKVVSCKMLEISDSYKNSILLNIIHISDIFEKNFISFNSINLKCI